MKVYGLTDVGKVRTNNQDSVVSGKFDDGTVWAVVCDGMGGANGGNIASSVAVKSISESIAKSYRRGMNSASVIRLMDSAISAANSEIFEMAANDKSLAGMGTTVVLTIVAEDNIFIAHAGDSRAYLISSDDEIVQLTRDHSIVQSMIENGQLTAEQARFHPSKNVITRALGVDEVVEVEFTESKIKDSDKLLLCTDGLTNYTNDKIVVHIIDSNPLKDVPKMLIDAANKNGGGDNISVVVIANKD